MENTRTNDLITLKADTLKDLLNALYYTDDMPRMVVMLEHFVHELSHGDTKYTAITSDYDTMKCLQNIGHELFMFELLDSITTKSYNGKWYITYNFTKLTEID